MKSFKELETNKKILVIFLLCLILFGFYFGFKIINNQKIKYQCGNVTKYFDNQVQVDLYHVTTKCYKLDLYLEKNLNDYFKNE